MTPKEKAKDLVNSFYQPLGYLKCGVNNTIMWEHAKQCALIAVDEVLKYQPYDVYTIEQCNNVNNYWNEVKQEIEKL
jgi:hypothetical protein